MSTHARARWPMIGRSTERDSVLSILRDGGRGVLIHGDAGVGKSSLAAAVLADLVTETGAPQVIRLHTDDAVTSTPWTVFAPLLDPVAQDAAGLEDALSLVRMGLPDQQPVLIHLEDAHLLDEPSATVLAEILQSPTVTLLATARHHPALPGPLAALWREGILERLDLPPLEHTAVAELLTHVLGGPIAQETAREIARTTAGNPLYLRELVLALMESEAFRQIEGAWLWDGTGLRSHRLADLVGQELAGLDASAREVVELVALAGTVSLVRVGEATSDEALAVAIGTGLLEVDRDPLRGTELARITHPVHAETVRSLIYPNRRRHLFGLMAPPATHSPDLAELFHWVSWALQCGITLEQEYLVSATRAAAAVQSMSLTIRMAGEALPHLDHDPEAAAEVLLLRATALRFSGEPDRAEKDLAQARTMLGRVDPSPDRDLLWVRCAEVSADLQQYHSDDLDGALQTLVGARNADPICTSAALQRLDINRLTRLGYAGRYRECVAEARARLFGPDAYRGPAIQLAPVLALGLAHQGHLDEALEVTAQALHTWDQSDGEYPWLHGEIRGAWFLTNLWRGDLAAATSPPGRARLSRSRYDEAVSQAGVGRYFAALGQWSRAVDQYRGALSRFAIRDPSGLAGMAWIWLSQAYAALGSEGQARAARTQYLARTRGMTRSVAADCRYTLAQVAVALGEADAHQQAVDYTAWCAGQGWHLGVLWGRHLALQTAPAADRAGLLDGLVTAAGCVDGPVPHTIVDHGRALVANDSEVTTFRIKELAELGVWVPVAPLQVRLTRRQREIAELVRQGLTNREIAARLVVSVRTVDTHVGHIFTRLRIHNRADLTHVLARSAP